MNVKKLQTIGVTFSMAALVAAGVAATTAKNANPPPVPESVTAAARGLGDAFAAVAERMKPCVVSVHSEKTVKMNRSEGQSPLGEDLLRRFFEENPQIPQPKNGLPRSRRFHQGGLGSGIILDKEGHILTNNHVVKDVDEIKVTLADKRSFEAEIVGTDPKTDLAIIKIKGKVPADLVTAALGDSDAMRVGEWVLAFGAPFGYEQTMTAGIVSAKGRPVGVTEYEDYIQTDAAINPGNSGGPLVNLRGEVIGINTVIATSIGQSAGVGFAIPINMAKGILPTLAKGGTVSRGLLGVVIQEVNDDLARQFKLGDTKGALVAQVNEASAAEKAGIKSGDVIVKFNDKSVEDTHALRNMVAATAPGTKVEILLLRDGKEHNVTAKLGDLSSDSAAAGSGHEEESSSASAFGLNVEPLTKDKAKDLGYDGEIGVLVAEVEDNSAAAKAELQPGDLITEVNRQKTGSISEFKSALAKASAKDNILLLVKRQSASRFVILHKK